MAFFQDLVTLESEIIKLLENNIDPKIISRYLSYIITGNIESRYNHDLELMLKIDYKENYGLTNILLKMSSEHAKTPLPYEEPLIIPIPSFNLTFKNQRGLHPAIDFLYSHVSSFHYEKSETILDIYIDDTFGPNQEVYELLKIVPYVNNWYGFVYDTNNLFDSKIFISSLVYCKGLFVFSEDLKKKLEHTLAQRNLNIKVSLFYFPVEEPKLRFRGNVDSIISKNSLETANVFSFYKNSFKLKTKYWFKSSKEQILKKYILSPTKSPSTTDINLLSTTLSPTNWNLELFTHIYKLTNSVLELEEYNLDELLSNNIVFCNIVSGSVVWILNECIVRNTPVIVNRHPVVIELLGPDYPLYFTDCSDSDIVITTKQIRKAHKIS
jgi:hypothetical protein